MVSIPIIMMIMLNPIVGITAIIPAIMVIIPMVSAR